MEKKSNSQSVSDYRRNRKLNLMKASGNRCCICGYNRTVSALEFHHINPEEKEYGIAAQGTCHNIQRDIAEIRKCVLVCANCHREIHEGFYNAEQLKKYQKFDEEFINQLTAPPKSQVPQFCSKCGASISGDGRTGMCLSCFRETTRSVERPNREELKELIQKYNFTELGRVFGVTDNSVRKWCKIYNLPYRKKDIVLIEDWSDI